ncbi:MAG TPA: cytochrome b [Beijerinckiaceae bacterium]|jgi:cytochrome b561
MEPRGYAPAQKWLHWTIALLIVVQAAVGLTMARLGDGELKNTLYELHKSVGLVVLALALVRILVRARKGAPPLEPGIPGWQRLAAHLSHYALYVLIVVVPLAGWTATSSCCAPVNLFWTIPLTLPAPGSEAFAKAVFLVHFALAFTLVGVALVHAAAALHHHFVRRDATLLRMLPRRSSARSGA